MYACAHARAYTQERHRDAVFILTILTSFSLNECSCCILYIFLAINPPLCKVSPGSIFVSLCLSSTSRMMFHLPQGTKQCLLFLSSSPWQVFVHLRSDRAFQSLYCLPSSCKGLAGIQDVDSASMVSSL